MDFLLCLRRQLGELAAKQETTVLDSDFLHVSIKSLDIFNNTFFSVCYCIKFQLFLLRQLGKMVAK